MFHVEHHPLILNQYGINTAANADEKTMFHVEQFMQDQCSISIRVSIRCADKLFISPCLYTSQNTQQGEEGSVSFIKYAEINVVVLLF